MTSTRHPIVLGAPEPFGADLRRPECVLTSPSGDVYVPDWPGGVTVVRANGTAHTWRANTSIDLRPNGIAIDRDRTFLIANLGDDGGVWRLALDGTLTPFLNEIEGRPLPPVNFVSIDPLGRTWISVSTRHVPRQPAWRRAVADGLIILVDEHGARIVADGIHYTNEVRVDPSGEWLYVVETFGRRLRRWRVDADGSLHAPEVVVELGRGGFPDGFAFDEDGGVWMTSLVNNQLLRWYDGRLEVVMSETNEAFVDDAERAFAADALDASHLGPIPGVTIQQMTNVAFGAVDRRTVCIGTLHNTTIFRFRARVAGIAPVHWMWSLP